MKNKLFDELEKSRHCRYFSEEFKKLKVKELERNLVTISDLCKAYEVSRTSVYRWVYKYSVMTKKDVKQIVEAKSDTQKIKMLEDRIKELERIVGQKQIQLEFKDKMIEIAESTYGVDIKKKLNTPPWSGSITTNKPTDTK